MICIFVKALLWLVQEEFKFIVAFYRNDDRNVLVHHSFKHFAISEQGVREGKCWFNRGITQQISNLLIYKAIKQFFHFTGRSHKFNFWEIYEAQFLYLTSFTWIYLLPFGH